MPPLSRSQSGPRRASSWSHFHLLLLCQNSPLTCWLSRDLCQCFVANRTPILLVQSNHPLAEKVFLPPVEREKSHSLSVAAFFIFSFFHPFPPLSLCHSFCFSFLAFALFLTPSLSFSLVRGPLSSALMVNTDPGMVITRFSPPLEYLTDPLEIIERLKREPELGFLYLTPEKKSLHYNPYNLRYVIRPKDTMCTANT